VPDSSGTQGPSGRGEGIKSGFEPLLGSIGLDQHPVTPGLAGKHLMIDGRACQPGADTEASPNARYLLAGRQQATPPYLLR